MINQVSNNPTRRVSKSPTIFLILSFTKSNTEVSVSLHSTLVDRFHTGIPKTLLPFQSGVGDVANAVLACISKMSRREGREQSVVSTRNNRFRSIEMYTEVVQDSIFDLLDSDKFRFASTTALTFSPKGQTRFFNELTELKSEFVLRAMEISNNPEVIRRIGFITMNTALEADIYGNVNTTHGLGSSMMNGIGGSGDFTRNAVSNLFIADPCPTIR